MTQQIPAGTEKYSGSPVFIEDTIPDARRKDHRIKAYVWGRIVVEDGTFIYLHNELPAQRVKAGKCATILPEEPHSVTPDGDVSFKVILPYLCTLAHCISAQGDNQ